MPPQTHHMRILEALRRRIREGELAPGTLLPKETELAAQHGVARMTMNKVLTQLSHEGYLVRRKRLGTFVAQPRAQSAVMAINDIAQEAAARGQEHQWQMQRCDALGLSDAERALLDLDPDPAAPVLCVTGMHRAGGAPFCLETRAINLALSPRAAEVDFAAELPGRWLLRSMPWSAARTRIRAINVAAAEARALDIAVGAACLEVLRKTEVDGGWVTHVRLLYPGEAHQLVADFAP